MQSKKWTLIETGATLINDNLINLFLVMIAARYYNISLYSSFQIVIIGQGLNVVCTYFRRRFFNRINNAKREN